MSRLILDIETAGRDIESFDSATQDYLLKRAKSEEEVREVKESLSFYPLTGEIIAIGLLNPDTRKGVVYFQSPSSHVEPFEENSIRFEAGTEEYILRKFWDTIKSYKQVITFNGRSFDCPFILIRSAVHKIKPVKDLMPYRYSTSSSHLDILDQLTFYGATQRRFSLDMWCRTFGIKSPKAEGVTGYDIKNLFDSGRHVDIARYCAGDLFATGELFFFWENYIKANP